MLHEHCIAELQKRNSQRVVAANTAVNVGRVFQLVQANATAGEAVGAGQEGFVMLSAAAIDCNVLPPGAVFLLLCASWAPPHCVSEQTQPIVWVVRAH